MNILLGHVYPKALSTAPLAETLPGRFYLDEEEECLVADKLHKVVKNRVLVAQESRAEVRFISTGADLRQEQAEQPLSPVPDVIGCHRHGIPRFLATLRDLVVYYQTTRGWSMPLIPGDSMTEPVAFWQGQFVPQSQARLPLHDAGFVMGATVTDLCRTVRHQLYRWPDHLARFRASCRATRIFPPIDEQTLNEKAQELVRRNAALLTPEQDLALVLLATPGPIGYYLGHDGGPGDAEATFAMHTFPLPLARYRHLFQVGAHLVIPATRQVPGACVDPRVKQRSRLHWWLADREAQQVERGAAALLLDADGHVTETAAANFLVVRGGVVLSPPADAVLGGVSLQMVRELCAELGMAFTERPLTVYDCLNADEAMLTSTPYFLAGVSRINGVPLPWPGAIFRRLLEAWGSRLGLDIRGQIEGTTSETDSHGPHERL